MRALLFQRCCRASAAALMAGLIAACGGGDAATPVSEPVQQDPLPSFAQQKLDWQACDPTLLGEESNALKQLGDRAQCALMRAPLDYSQPGLGELQVAVLRVAAEQPRQRSGAIVFNPGGPGADGLGLAALFGALWRGANPASPEGQALLQLSNRYDMIGFSPRGVGASSSLTCISPELKEIESSLVFDRSPENLAAALRNARLEAQACRKNPLTKHIHTDATARDMDLLRSLLGDAQLNYIGYSYGTWLGGWYASLFPERVGRMLLDSSMDLSAGFDEAGLQQAMARQRMIDEILLPYVVRHPESFNLGDSVPELRNALLALPPALKSQLFSALNLFRPAEMQLNGLMLNSALELQALLQRNPAADAAQLHAAIDAHTFIPVEADNAKAATLAYRWVGGLFTPARRESVLLLPEVAVNVSVRCNDLATRGDAQHWIDLGNESAARYPFTGGLMTGNPCIFWGAPVTARPPLATAAMAGPVLLLQSRYDALTAVEGAQANLDRLPNSSLIVVEDEYRHGLFPYGQACVDEKVAAYFLQGALPVRLSSCAGKPLAGDAGDSGEAGPAARQRRTPAAGVATYQNSAQAEALQAQIHRRIGKVAQRRF